MAQRYNSGYRKRRQKKTRRSGCVTTLIVAVLVCAMLFGSFYLLKDYFSDTQEKIENLAYPREYSELVSKYSEEYDVREAFIYAIIKTESGFDENAESYVGARGLMQIMPETFEWLQTHVDDGYVYTEDDLFIPEVNIKYGTYFLSYLLEHYDGNEATAAAAYNAGFAAVDEWLCDPSYSSDGKNLDYIPYEETSKYVVKVTDSRDMYIELYYSEQ